jgi:hypothetical protein
MLALKGNYPFPDFSVKRDFASRPLPHFPGTHYSIIPSFHHSIIPTFQLRSEAELSSYVGQENR